MGGAGGPTPSSRSGAWPHEPTRAGVHVLDPLGADRRAVDQHVAHAGRLVGGEALGVGREVGHTPNRPRRDGHRVEDDDVGDGPGVRRPGR